MSTNSKLLGVIKGISFLKGFVTGSIVIGTSVYYYMKQSKNIEISALESGEIQTESKVKKVVDNTLSSLQDGFHRTTEKLEETIHRLNKSFYAGQEAAKEKLKEENLIEERKKDVKITETNMNKTSVPLSDSEKKMGAVEDTTRGNTSALHPTSNNIAPNIGDGGTRAENITKDDVSKIKNDKNLNI